MSEQGVWSFQPGDDMEGTHHKDITLPPPFIGFHVTWEGDEAITIELVTPQIPDAYSPIGETTDGDLRLEIEGEFTVDDIPRLIAMSHIVFQTHEAFEFTRRDGQRVAEPHPDPDESDMWTWLCDQALALVDGYAKQWPAESVKKRKKSARPA